MAGGAPGDDRKRSRYIWIRGKKDQSSWEWMRRLARNWDEIEQLVGELGDGPWFVTSASRPSSSATTETL